MVGIESLKYQNLGDFLYPKIDENEYHHVSWSHFGATNQNFLRTNEKKALRVKTRKALILLAL